MLNSYLSHLNPGHKEEDSFMARYSSPRRQGIDFKEPTMAGSLTVAGLAPPPHVNAHG